MTVVVLVVTVGLLLLGLAAFVTYRHRRPIPASLIVPAIEDDTAQTLGRLDVVVNRLESITDRLEHREGVRSGERRDD